MVRLIETRGDARECGRQHGEAVREQIRRSVDYYREAFLGATGLSWPQVLELVPRWLPAIEAYSPELLPEVLGIAEGANVRFEEVLALNGRGELAYGNPFDESADGCTSWAALPEATGTGHVYCGQNWDWRSETTDTVVLLSIELPSVEVSTKAGQLQSARPRKLQECHNYGYIVVQSQGLIPLLADPFGRGWSLLPTAAYQPSFMLANAAIVWYVQIILIVVVGHVIAVYLAHLRAGERFRNVRRVLISQYPMLVLMVLYTMTSLWILAQPITREV